MEKIMMFKNKKSYIFQFKSDFLQLEHRKRLKHLNILAKVPKYCVNCDEIPGSSFQTISWVSVWVWSYVINVCSWTVHKQAVDPEVLHFITSVASLAAVECVFYHLDQFNQTGTDKASILILLEKSINQN